MAAVRADRGGPLGPGTGVNGPEICLQAETKHLLGKREWFIEQKITIFCHLKGSLSV